MKTVVFPIISVFLILKVAIIDAADLVEFISDRQDGRLIWINLTTANTAGEIEKIEYRLLRNTSSSGSGSDNQGGWTQLQLDPHHTTWPAAWQKPDGICAEYEMRVVTRNAGAEGSSTTNPSSSTPTTTIREPLPVRFKEGSKPFQRRLYYDPTKSRVVVEMDWGNDFDYWTGAGAVLAPSSGWIKFLGCRSLFNQPVPPPIMENNGRLWEFDPEFARNNCSFLFGVNGTLDMMRVPPPGFFAGGGGGNGGGGQPLVLAPSTSGGGGSGGQVQVLGGQGQGQGQQGQSVPVQAQPVLVQLPNGQVIQMASNSAPVVGWSMQQQQQGGAGQAPIVMTPQQGSPVMLPPQPHQTRRRRQSSPSQQQDLNNNNCTKIDFSTLASNDSLQVNLSCESVIGSSMFCAASQQQQQLQPGGCLLDCSPTNVTAFNMQDQDTGQEYLKIEWDFPNTTLTSVRRYQVRYAEANVTAWNTAYTNQVPVDVVVNPDKKYVEIRNFSSGPGKPYNLTIQICANLNDACNNSNNNGAQQQVVPQWDQQRTFAVGYLPIGGNGEDPFGDLVQSAGYGRRKGKNAGNKVSIGGGGCHVVTTIIIALLAGCSL